MHAYLPTYLPAYIHTTSKHTITQIYAHTCTFTQRQQLSHLSMTIQTYTHTNMYTYTTTSLQSETECPGLFFCVCLGLHSFMMAGHSLGCMARVFYTPLLFIICVCILFAGQNAWKGRRPPKRLPKETWNWASVVHKNIELYENARIEKAEATRGC